MNDLSLLIELIVILLAVWYFMRQTRSNQTRLEADLQKIRKMLLETAIVLHEYRKFKTAFDYSYDAMIITDVDGKILYFNSSALRLYGYSRSQMIGTKAGKLWGGQMSKKYYRDLWHRIKTEGQPFIGQITNRRKNGQRYVAALTISPLFEDESDKPFGFVAIERDITEKTFPEPSVVRTKPVARKS